MEGDSARRPVSSEQRRLLRQVKPSTPNTPRNQREQDYAQFDDDHPFTRFVLSPLDDHDGLRYSSDCMPTEDIGASRQTKSHYHSNPLWPGDLPLREETASHSH